MRVCIQFMVVKRNEYSTALHAHYCVKQTDISKNVVNFFKCILSDVKNSKTHLVGFLLHINSYSKPLRWHFSSVYRETIVYNILLLYAVHRILKYLYKTLRLTGVYC